MLRQLEQIPYVKALVKRLRRNQYLRDACGYRDKPPCYAHFYQMKKRIGVEGFRMTEAWLRREALRLRRSQPLSATGLIQAVGLDGTDLPAWSSRDPHDTRRGLGDPDARLSRGKKRFLLGYLSLFLIDIEGFPLGHLEAPLNVNEKQLVEELLHRVLEECIEGARDYDHTSRIIHCRLPRLLGKELICFGIGVKPVRSFHGKRVVKWLMENAAAVSTRDPASERELRKIGLEGEIRVTGDSALFLDSETRDTATLEELGLGH